MSLLKFLVLSVIVIDNWVDQILKFKFLPICLGVAHGKVSIDSDYKNTHK